MRTRRMTALITLLLVSAALAGPASAADTLTVVGTDPTGDWSSDANVSMIGASMGQDLTQAAVAMADDQTIEFQIQVASMPPHDPTLTGLYVWGFKVEKQYRTLVSCGNFIEDCEARDHFAVLGECATADDPVMPPELDPIECDRLGEAAATYSADGLISIPVPLDVLEVDPGTTLKMKRQYVWATPYVSFFGGADPSFYSFDLMKTTENFTIPHATS